MAHAASVNQALNTTNEAFHGIWKLTRTMLAAGYAYKASADALGSSSNKDVTGNMTFDKWGLGGLVNGTAVGGQTGAAASIGAASSGVSTITGLTGMVANSVGRFLTISGAATGANNGTFRIVSQASSTSVGIFNPAAVSDANNAAISWTESRGGAAASIAAPSGGRSTITGLTGMVVPTSTSRGSEGDRLTISGAATGANNGTFRIVEVLSTTSVKIDNPAAVSDANNGSVEWTEMSPTAQAYPSSITGATGTGAWVCLQGPSTLKIPIGTANPIGYLRGENVTQTSTGAEGELMGVVPDPAGGLGFIVVSPRVGGSGGGARGWSVSGGATDNVTCATSGVVITPLSSGSVVEFVQEWIFWKNVALTGHVFVQCVDAAAENTSRFSTQAALSQCTNVICPGGSTGGVVTTNGFPTLGTFTVLGTGGSGAAGTGSANWYLSSTVTNLGRHHTLVANAIEKLGVSADGTWTFALGSPGSSASAYLGGSYQRMDNSEEGDVWPYAVCIPAAATNYAGNRTVFTGTLASADSWAGAQFAANAYTPWRGWRRRGFPTLDAYQDFQGAAIGAFNSTSIINLNAATADRVACAIVVTVVREPLWVVSTQTAQRMRKGSCRWLHMTQGGSGNDTYDSKTWVQLSSRTDGAIAVGPWDGSTTPVNS